MARKLLLSLEEASLTFGGKAIFENISLNISEGDKICLVGRNGAGKTTLMRLIMGELEIDSGRRFVLRGTRIGYLEQSIEFDISQSVRQYVMTGLEDDTDSTDNGSDISYLVDIIISPLGFKGDEKMQELSGGQLRRAALARALVAEPDILLLDEPTNHLDLETIEWLEGYLSAYRGAVLCVSHDRAFLKNISSKIFWIDRGNIRTCNKGYEHFDSWAEELLQQEERTLNNLQKKLESEHKWTQGGVTARRKRNVRRMRELQRLREKLKADKASYRSVTSAIKFDSFSTVEASKVVVEFKDVSKWFIDKNTAGDKRKRVLEGFHFRVLKGDRIGIIGKNGSGKTTFLKLLMGEILPDTGRIKLGKKVKISYFDQYRTDLNPKKTVWETLCPSGGDYIHIGSGKDKRHIHVCGYLKDFLFDPRIAKERVSTLSGGQQSRLMLAKILANPSNVMILDEPTNDLDMDTLDMLQDIIADYDGTLFIVSHDRDFLDRTVTKILAFEGEGIVQEYIGGYSDYLAARDKVINKNRAVEGSICSKDRGNDSSRDVQHKENNKKKKLSYKLQYELDRLPSQIAELEREIREITEELSDSDLYIKDPARFDEISLRLVALEEELEDKELRWLELEEMSGG